MNVGRIAEQFDRGGSGLPGAAEIGAVRRAALERFEQLGFPGRGLETWHYTDLSRLGESEFDFVGAEPNSALVRKAAAVIEGLELDERAPRLVFLDGYLIEPLSSASGFAGLEIGTLADRAGELLNPASDEPALAALNTALASAGALIRVSSALAEPIQLVFLAGGSGRASQLRLRIELAPAASAAVVQQFADLDPSGEGWINLVTDLELGEDSALSVYRLQQLGAGRICTSLARAALQQRASLSAASIELGGKLVRSESLLDLNGIGAVATVRGLALTRERQHCDTRIAIDHKAAQTCSRQDYRAIASDRSRSIFNGKVTVHEDAQDIDARQRNDNLLLSATAEIDSKPELEIYADQVVCSHGATVGELSEEQLFYLRSRGIDAQTARGILTTAFAAVILDELELEAFRERSRQAVASALPQYVEIE